MSAPASPANQPSTQKSEPRPAGAGGSQAHRRPSGSRHRRTTAPFSRRIGRRVGDEGQRAKRANNANSKRSGPRPAASFLVPRASCPVPRTCARHVVHVCSGMCSPCAQHVLACAPVCFSSPARSARLRTLPVYTCAVRALPCARMRSSCKINPLCARRPRQRPTANSQPSTADSRRPSFASP